MRDLLVLCQTYVPFPSCMQKLKYGNLDICCYYHFGSTSHLQSRFEYICAITHLTESSIVLFNISCLDKMNTSTSFLVHRRHSNLAAGW